MDGLPFRMEELPEYNNQKHEMKELKEIFDGIPGYGLEFQTEKINEMLMTRDVTVRYRGSRNWKRSQEKLSMGMIRR